MMSSINDSIQILLSAEPDPKLSYYAVTILCSEDGTPGYSCFSGWVGFTDESPRREIRKASLVKADRVVHIWRDVGQTTLVINTPDDMTLFFAFGGNAVIEKSIAQSFIPEWLAPSKVAHVGQYGFIDLETLPVNALQRAPTPKHRMRIIKRDNYRCRICGRSPKDYVDLELHVHHIRPWATGGVTEDTNLITLCHTCHNGLDPHFEYSLYDLLPGSSPDHHTEYLASLRRYQTEIPKRWLSSEET